MGSGSSDSMKMGSQPSDAGSMSDEEMGAPSGGSMNERKMPSPGGMNGARNGMPAP
jgi:hypothetical protein